MLVYEHPNDMPDSYEEEAMRANWLSESFKQSYYEWVCLCIQIRKSLNPELQAAFDDVIDRLEAILFKSSIQGLDKIPFDDLIDRFKAIWREGSTEAFNRCVRRGIEE